ncbi:MAG: tetratricopeptide repeat protein [Phycisphaerales bacterium]
MRNDTAARAHAIFTRALGLDPDQRDAMVREACGQDADVLRRVQRLLKAADQSTGFLESPALASRFEPLPDIPDAVGTYLVIGVLGMGGMATVYEAVQENPNRRVAIKVMRQAMTSTDSLLRFRLETQTLARLRHPAIAQIYEAGTAQLGQPKPTPFFAMELIPDALSITEYADRAGLSLRQRLEMFASVCDAVLHGHQNGIIHRDIKPANVLVGPDGQPKVIDFGIARSTQTGSPALTGAANASSLIGTLNSMSPEQCVDPANIDVRSDVYSLGVLLYELVTGRLPHDLSRCSIPQAVRIITEVEPSRAGSLRPEAAGDLEAIIAMAMEKDRARRYVGAGALAADVRRYLGNQPIEARHSTTIEQVRKFARRNPPLAAALASSVALLLIGVVVSARFAYVASRARDAALEREHKLEIVTEFQECLLRELDVAAMGDGLRTAIGASLRESARSEGGDEAVSTAIEDWNRLATRLNFTTLAAGSLSTSVLQRYASLINERLADQPVLRARLLQQLADTMNSLGLHADALPIITAAYDLRRASQGEDHADTLQSRHSVGSLLSTLGRFDEALVHLAAAYERRRLVLGPDDRATLNSGTSLGGLYRRKGNLPEAERVWTDTLARQRRVLGDDDPATLRMLNNIGVLYAVQGRLDLAEASWRELLERRRRVQGADHPDYLGSLGNLGVLLQDQGRFTEAEPLIRESLAADRRRHGDAHSATLTSMTMLASLLRETGELAEAESLQRECYEGRVALLGPEHADTLRAKAALGGILHARGQTAEGERMIRESFDVQMRALGESHADSIDSLALLRDAARETARRDEAMELSTRLIRLIRESPLRDSFDAGNHLSIHGALLLAVGRVSDARAAMLEGYETLNRVLRAAHPQTRAAAARLADFYAKAHEREPKAGHDQEHLKWLRLSEPTRP